MKENVLVDKSIDFAARIVKLHDYMVRNKKGLTIAKQIVTLFLLHDNVAL